MFCLEFDVRSVLPLLYEDSATLENLDKDLISEEELLATSIRVIDQDMVESTLYFYINGVCHG